MKHETSKLIGFTLLLLVCGSLRSFGQERPQTNATTQERAQTNATTISADDKREIISLFKGVDSKLYRLQFNSEVYGSKKIEMRDLTQVKRVSNPLDVKGWVIISHSDHGIMSFVAVTKGRGTSLVSVLGKEKAAKLTAIMGKYTLAEALGD